MKTTVNPASLDILKTLLKDIEICLDQTGDRYQNDSVYTLERAAEILTNIITENTGHTR